MIEASGQVLAIAEGWVRGPSHEPVDDPTQIGPIIEKLLAEARKPSGMNGVPGGPPAPLSLLRRPRGSSVTNQTLVRVAL